MLLNKWLALASIGQAFAARSAGCQRKQRLNTVGKTLNVTLGDRRYLLYVPPTYSSAIPAPVVLSFHGGTRTAEDQKALDLLTTPDFNKGHIIIYPNGLNYTWEGVPNVTTKDTQFVTKILNEVEKEYCIDHSRIFATGKSQGGGFVGVLACDSALSTRIAAFAPVSGAYYVSNVSVCDPATVKIPCDPGRKHVPVLAFHGGADGTISIDGGPRKGGCLPTIEHWVNEWAIRDALGTKNTSVSLTEAATEHVFGAGDERSLVTFVYDGDKVDHSWPYTGDNPDNLQHGDGPASFNATPVILDFFKEHPLPAMLL
ncbi:Feruloyl esterase B [Pleurostoma richardsiae]|uniref:feruloyl esterase n=1 Tax=Pleurostoma richardsiae TaxID=41990 RepID=A0AA38R6J7_9PEZI|nr:Feruloyl esterase B [Pleurostoma richardsiae]